MVDLPEPVLPMMAVVWPRRRTKSRLRRVSSSASSKRKLTWSKRATSLASAVAGCAGFSPSARPVMAAAVPTAGSLIAESMSRTSFARERHAQARGICRTQNWAIIMKNMMSMAYSTRADMEPICMA